MRTKNVPRPKPSFLEFIRKNLPKDLVLHSHHDGYCTTEYYVEQKGTGISFPWCRRNRIARVMSGHGEVELLDESWHMDVVDLILKYESITQEEVTLVRQVGPKYD